MISLGTRLNFQEIGKYFSIHLQSLKSFQFSILNPVFWLFFVILFLVMLKFWRPKKSFSFSLAVAFILLAETKFETLLSSMVIRHGEVFDPSLLRIGAIFFIAVIWLYYGFVQSDS